MYKLFINNIHIGNYRTMKNMTTFAFNATILQKGVKSVEWVGKSLYIRTND